jgi:class 3 adenylate cyclase/tetratricopeptide (TPR) repeat protein
MADAEPVMLVEPTSPAERLVPYVPLVVLEWLRSSPDALGREIDGTLAFVDISGFTSMSERLARLGKAGAEELTEAMNATFGHLLAIAYEFGGGLLKFGGDALLVFYSGPEHAARACAAAHRMRRSLREHGRLTTSAGNATLRMHVGLHSGPCHFVLAGTRHRELIITGPGATSTVEMERAAETGEIVVSAATAATLPKRSLGEPRAEGFLLASEPPATPQPNVGPLPDIEGLDLESCVPEPIRQHLTTGSVEPEHRQATVAFIRFEGTDELLEAEGADALATAVDEIVSCAQEAAAEHKVCFLESDIDADGGRIILVAGAPLTAGDDEERMLRTTRAIVDAGCRLPVRIGVNRGAVFAGEVGSQVRRSYTILGDTAALAARLVARAGAGEILTTPDLLERSNTLFESVELEPFQAKGKAQLVVAHSVGSVGGTREAPRQELPLVGRQRELAILAASVAPARMGYGTFVELVGDAGIGKSRIAQELRVQCEGMRVVAATCNQYESATPYSVFGGVLRSLLEVDSAAALRDRVAAVDSELVPWLPLLAVPLDIQTEMTPEVEALDASFRRARLNGVVAVLLSKLLAGPTLLLLEDVHWMDEASCDLLRHLGEQAASWPWLTCVTRRPTGEGFVAAQGTPPVAAMTIQLEPLQPADARQLVAATASGLMPAEIDAITERAGGNPLFLQELVTAGSRDEDLDELPESVVGLVTARIDKLAPAERTLLRWASVLGASFSGAVIEQVLEGDPAASVAAETWDKLTEFVERDPYTPGGFRFRHAVFRDAAYEGLSFRRRRDLHLRIGEVYEAKASSDEEYVELLSLHFHRAQSWERAWRYSLAAGKRAQEKFANVEAADFYRHALDAARHLAELEPREIAQIWELLGDVSELAGRYTDAAEAYRNARRRAPDAEHEPRLLLKEGVIRERLGTYSEALRWYRRGLTAVEQVTDERERTRQRVELSLAYAGVRFRQGEFFHCIEWSRRAVDDAQTIDDLAGLAHAYYLLHIGYMSLGAPEREAFRGLALPIYEELGDLPGQANVLNNLGIDAYYEGRWADALDLYERSRQARERIGDIIGAATIVNNSAEILSDRGELEEAERGFQEAKAVCTSAGYRFIATLATSNLGRAAARGGRFDEAQLMLDDAHDAFREMKASAFVLETEARLAEVDVLAGRHAKALERLTSTLDEASTTGAQPVLLTLLHRLRGYALVQAGDAALAEAAFELSASIALSADAQYELALTREAQSRRADAAGDSTLADRLGAESGEILERLGVVSTPVVPLP